MPAIVSVVGISKSGKTTLIEKLVRELRSRGYRVATVKHAPEGMTLDRPDRDSWRHLQAGSEATVISSRDRLALIKPVTAEATLDDIARLLGEEYDIILTEGFKQGDAPKIEVHRKEAGPPLTDIKKLIAIATDEPLDAKARQFSLDDARGLADLLEEGFIRPHEERISLYVNNARIPLTAFPREFITSTLGGMLSALKGVDRIESVEIFLRKRD